jgi:integrase
MRVTVLGAGSWEATVTALLCRRDHEVLLWARNPEVAGEVDEQRTNTAPLTGARLPARLRATGGHRAGIPARRADLRGVTLHTLRHSAASFLLAAGTYTKVVEEHLGHSPHAITADIYSHAGPAQQREAWGRVAVRVAVVMREAGRPSRPTRL